MTAANRCWCGLPSKRLISVGRRDKPGTAAWALGVSRQTVYRWIWAARLHSTRFGGRVLVYHYEEDDVRLNGDGLSASIHTLLADGDCLDGR